MLWLAVLGGFCRLMQSCVAGVYAAGDACSIAWTDQSPHWFQMRLWTQASSSADLCMLSVLLFKMLTDEFRAQ